VPPYREPPTERFELVANFRDLGGHVTHDGRRVRFGRLFRSGHLAHATEADIETLSRLGVRTVFDFRNTSDIEKDGEDRLPKDARYVRLPMPNPDRGADIRSMIRDHEGEALEAVFGDGKAAQMMTDAAASLVTERADVYAQFMAQLCAPETAPALFHCSAGKDRAGWAGSVVLLALGVDEEEVIEQYLLSNREAIAIIARLSNPDREEWKDLFLPFIEVRREYFEASLAAVRDGWGSFDGYLSERLGIDEARRARLRESLLE